MRVLSVGCGGFPAGKARNTTKTWKLGKNVYEILRKLGKKCKERGKRQRGRGQKSKKFFLGDLYRRRSECNPILIVTVLTHISTDFGTEVLNL